MNGVQVRSEAVEAGARGLADWLNLDYDRIGDGQKTLTSQAEALLNAAALLIVADAFEGVKAEVENLAAQRDAIGDDDYEPDEDDGDCCGDAGECHRSGAMASYARVISLLERKVAELRAQT